MAATETDMRTRQGAGRSRQAAGRGQGLGQKVGPLPLWAWIGGAVVVVYFLYRKAASGGQGANCPAGYVFDPNSNQCVQVASAATAGTGGTTSQSPFPTIGGVFEPLQTQAGPASTPPPSVPQSFTSAAPAASNEQYVGGGYAGPAVAGGATNTWNQFTYPLTSIITSTGATLSPVSNQEWQNFNATGLPAGTNYYYQPSPGLYIPAGQANVPAGTPLWLGPAQTSGV